MAKSPVYTFETRISSYNNKKKFSSRKIAVVATSTKTLADLAYTVLAAYGFGGEHLFEFNLLKTAEEQEFSEQVISLPNFRDEAFPANPLYNYYLPDPSGSDFGPDRDPFSSQSVFEAKLVRLQDELKAGLTFLYDFGDGWEFQVNLTEIQTDDAINRRDYPKVLEGKGPNLADDTGGYDYFLDEFGKDKDFQFNLQATNMELKREVSWLKDVYEHPSAFAEETADFFGFGNISESDLNQAASEMFKELLKDKETRQEIRKLLAAYDD